MGPATLGLGSHVDSPHGSLRLVSLEIQQPGLSPSRINWCGPWGHAPKQQPRGQPASCSWRCESKHERHRFTTSELSCTHISLPTRTWFSGSGWQLGCAPGCRIPVLTVEEYKGSLTPAPRRIMFQVLGVRPCPCCLDCSASHWTQVTPPRNSGGDRLYVLSWRGEHLYCLHPSQELLWGFALHLRIQALNPGATQCTPARTQEGPTYTGSPSKSSLCVQLPGPIPISTLCLAHVSLPGGCSDHSHLLLTTQHSVSKGE